MKNRLALATLFGLGLPLGACGDKSSDDTAGGASDTDTDTDTDSTTDTDTDTDADTDAPPGEVASVRGTVQFADGTPAEGLQIRLCYYSCKTYSSDASGGFEYIDVEAATHTLQAVQLGNTDWAIPNALITLDADVDRTLDTAFTMVEYQTKEALSGQATITGDGITISADEAGYVTGIYSPDPTTTWVATVEIDPSLAGLPADGMPGTPVAMWYLGNFDGEVEPVWSFSTTSSYGLAEGTKVDIYALDNIGKQWLSSGTGTVGTDGITTDDDSGLARLTTLILVPQD
jgi:hypothetical protein